MGVIQSSINQALGAVEHGLTALAVKNIAGGVKDIKGAIKDPEVTQLKPTKEQISAMQEYSTNPALQQMMKMREEQVAQNAVWKERMQRAKESTQNRYQTLSKQKKNTRTLEGQLMIDTSIGKLPQSIIDKAEVRDGE